MPFPPPSRALAEPRRRSLIVSAAGAALLAGCSTGSGEPESSGGSPAVAERARARAARDSQGLIERYDAVLAVHPALAERLGPLRAEVVRHAKAFGGTGQASPSASPSASASPSPATPTAPTSPAVPSAAVPTAEPAALAALAAAERGLADRRARALVELPGELARLLASVAAAGAAHAYLLTESAK